MITDEAIGPVRIGLNADSLRAMAAVVSDTTVPDNEGLPARVIRVAIGRDTVAATVVRDQVWRIAVETPGLATADSIHLGSPLSALIRRRDVIGAAGEGRVYVLDPSRCGMSFGLSREARLTRPELDSAALARLPSTTHVVEILVFGCRKADS